jgi:hypothetical protein
MVCSMACGVTGQDVRPPRRIEGILCCANEDIPQLTAAVHAAGIAISSYAITPRDQSGDMTVLSRK